MLCRDLSEGTEKNQENSQDIQGTGKDIKYAPLGYKWGSSRLSELIRYYLKALQQVWVILAV